jgi:hypothetical protein
MTSVIRVVGTPSSYFGYVEIEPTTAGAVGLRGLEDSVPAEIFRWHPPARLADQMPPGYLLEMIAPANRTDTRLFAPLHGAQQIILGREAGLAIVNSVQQLSNEQRSCYRSMFLLYGWLQSRQSLLRRGFTSSTELVVRRSGRPAVNTSDILPDDLGLDVSGQGSRWSVDTFLRRGHDAARLAGRSRPLAREVIAYGLAEAALLNPLHLSADDARPLIRMALYANGDESLPADDIINEVFARNTRALKEHQADGTERFNRWYSSGHSNLPKSLANRTTESFGKLETDVVKTALLELGWRSYPYLSNCLHALLRWFTNALGDEITADERSFFERMYHPQPVYGGLPLVMLMGRGTLIRPLIVRIWEEPDNRRLEGALHRVLEYYGRMTELRRMADRAVKQRTAAVAGIDDSITNLDNLVSQSGESDSRSQSQQMMGRIAEALAQRLDQSCDKCGGALVLKLADAAFTPGEPVRFIGTCAAHSDRDLPVEVPWNEVEEIGLRIEAESISPTPQPGLSRRRARRTPR